MSRSDVLKRLPAAFRDWVGDRRIEAMRLAEVYRGRVVDATTASFVFEVTGGRDKIDKFVDLKTAWIQL